MQLAGKSAIVTGGGRGIGRAIALGLAEAGCQVCVMARSRTEVDAVADQIRALGQTALALVCDVADAERVQTAFDQAVDQLGALHVLVNNAGGGELRTPIGQDDPQQWKQVIEVNLLGAYHCARAALPHLRRSGGGTILNVGSGMGHQPRAGNSSYNVSKAGLWMLTRCLALEVWQDNITVNELVPGPVQTQLTEGLFLSGQPHPTLPSEWVKDPQDVVPLAVFLASQSASGPTGQSFSLARRPL
jgi:3-oxoacyl-[acyl-carrier protein] reductase